MLKKTLSYLVVLCIALLVSSTFVVIPGAYDAPELSKEYYAGKAKSISVTDNSFADWEGQPIIEIDSTKYPENWEDALDFGEELVYRYALAWDTTNLYVFIQWDAPMTKLEPGVGLAAARLYFDVNSMGEGTVNRTGLVDFRYDSETGQMYVNRADNGRVIGNKPNFQSTICLYSKEINGVTTLEAAIPWVKMNDPFDPNNESEIRYSICAMTKDTNSLYLFGQDTSDFENDKHPFRSNSEYLTMTFGREIEPITSLGAKVNTDIYGLRFGAEYNKDESLPEVVRLGMLLYPTHKLDGATLNLAYWEKNSFDDISNRTGVFNIKIVGISTNFESGKAFEDYENFVFYVTLKKIPVGKLDIDVTAVPYISYSDGTVLYGAPLVRNFNAVSQAADNIPG